MLIKMTRSKHGSPDGVSVKHFKEGEVHDVPVELANTFVNSDKVAEFVKEEKAEKPFKNKAEKPASNKADEEVDA